MLSTPGIRKTLLCELYTEAGKKNIPSISPFSFSAHLYSNLLFRFCCFQLEVVCRALLCSYVIEKNLIAVKVIAEKTQNWMTFFLEFSLLLPGFWSQKQCQASLSILYKNISGAALAAADLIFPNIWKNVFSLLSLLKCTGNNTRNLCPIPKAFALFPPTLHCVSDIQ